MGQGRLVPGGADRRGQEVLEEGHVRNEVWGLWFGNQGVCVQSLAWIGATVAEI